MKKLTLAAVAAFALSTGPLRRPISSPKARGHCRAGAAGVGPRLRFGDRQRLYLPRHHAVEPQASVAAYFEPRYNFNKDHQLYVGIGGASIAFPNRAAAEIDFYAGYRPTFGKFAFDFGVWYYWYSEGTVLLRHRQLQHCRLLAKRRRARLSPFRTVNAIKTDLSFVELYGKVNYSVNRQFRRSVLSPTTRRGAELRRRWHVLRRAMPSTPGPLWPNGVQPYISGEVGHWRFGTSDSSTARPRLRNFAGGIPYADYTTWNVGLRLDLEGVHG